MKKKNVYILHVVMMFIVSFMCVIKAGISDPYNASFILENSVDNQAPFEGDTILFFVKLTALLDSRSDIVVQSEVPNGVSFVSSEVTQGVFDSGSGIWNVGTLAAGNTALLVLRVTIDSGTAGSQIVNTSSIIDAYDLDCYGNDCCFASVSISPQAICSASGDVLVEDILPATLTFINANATKGFYNPTSGIWNIGSMADGSSETLTINASVKMGILETQITSCASILDPYSIDPYSENNTACTTINIVVSTVRAGGLLRWSVIANGLAPDTDIQ